MHLTKPVNPGLQTAIGRIRRIVRRSQLPGIIARIRALKPAAVAQTTDDTLSAHMEEPEARQARLRAAVDRIGRAVQNKRLQCKKSELPKTIAAIKAAFLSDYRPSKPAYARFLTAATKLGLPVPALSVCGTGTREIRYTQLLAYYLDPRAMHGLGDRICRAVLGPEVAAFGVYDASWLEAEVAPEFDLGNVSFGKVQSGNQLDILIKLPECTVMIEHKIGSAEDASVFLWRSPRVWIFRGLSVVTGAGGRSTVSS